MKIGKRILFLVSTVSVVACGQVSDESTCWDTVSQSATGITPTPGGYNIQSTPATAATGRDDPGYPLTFWDFAIGNADAQGQFIRFSTDGYRYDEILVTNGTFWYVHGGGADDTVCPTDGYSISGHFTSTTEGSGHFEYIPACECHNGSDFMAQYVQY